MNQLGSRITYLRKKQGLSQIDLSKKLFLSQAQISNMEKNRLEISPNLASSLSYIFNVEKSYFEISPLNLQLQSLIEDAFEKIFFHKLTTFPFFEKYDDDYAIDIFQEISIKLLETIYRLRCGNKSEADYLIHNFIIPMKSLILSNLEINSLSKIYNLFLFEQNNSAHNFNGCLANCDILNSIFTNDDMIGRTKVMKSNVLYKMGKKVEAFRQIQDAIKFITHLNNDFLLATAYTCLSAVLISFKMYSETFDVLCKLEKLNLDINSNELSATIYQHRAYIYKTQKDYILATSNYQLALNEVTQVNVTNRMLITLLVCQIKSTNTEEASITIKRLRSVDLNLHQSMKLLSLECELNLMIGNETEFGKNIRNVLRYFEKGNYISDLYYIYSYLMQHYSDQNKYSKLNEFYKKREKLNYE